MNDKIALVTGSSSGIGLATSKELAMQGIQVMLNGLDDETIGIPLATSIEQAYGTKARYCQADLSDVAQIEMLFECIKTELGRIDILVNNAGIQYVAPTAEYPVEKWDKLLAVNLTAAFHTTRLALPDMKQSGWGRIVNIASVHGLVGSANKSAYCATKHGLVGLTKVVALEHAADGITANSICPGWTDTPILNDQIEAHAKQQNLPLEDATANLIRSKAPYPSLINPSAIGEMIVFLCSDAAKAITGTSLSIDGAWTAQ